jgi:DNA-binding NtrC family response regulator
MDGRILLVDDDPTALRVVREELLEEDIECRTASSGGEALRLAGEEEPRAVVLDLGLPDMDGLEVLRRLKGVCPEVPVVILTAQDDLSRVVECVQQGALDYIQKPFDRTRFLTTLRNARVQGELRAKVKTLAGALRSREGFGAILGESPAVRKLVEVLDRAARSDVTVLLEGESGTGKEVAARAIHAESGRRTGPFVAVNCGAIPEGVVESELFGHEKGSFTGALATRRGHFEVADGGTILLDEIGELRPDLQVRLLRVLQERVIQRVGGSRTLPVDVRVVASTNRDLQAEARKGAFREDLYYRLAVFPVRLPPLRERGDDVLLLAEAFFRRFSERHRKSVLGFTPEAEKAIRAYPWPGNVRELENVVERATILEDGERISLSSLPDALLACLGPEAPSASLPPGSTPGAYVKVDPGRGIAGAVPSRTGSFYAPALLAGAGAGDEILPFEEEERRIILRALERTSWNLQETATRLGIGRATVYRKIEKYGLRRGQPGE